MTDIKTAAIGIQLLKFENSGQPKSVNSYS